VVAGLVVFGAAFAVNSSLHSFLILAYSTAEDAAADVGFYYSANAAGRLFGTLMSGLLFLWGGLEVALWGAALSITLAWVLSLRFPSTT
jgi:predicted MFS family arabinose efflux permease